MCILKFDIIFFHLYNNLIESEMLKIELLFNWYQRQFGQKEVNLKL